MNSTVFSIVSARTILGDIAANCSPVCRQIIKESLATLPEPEKGLQALTAALIGGEFKDASDNVIKFDSAINAVYVQTELTRRDATCKVYEALADCFVGWCEDTKKADDIHHAAKVQRISQAKKAFADNLADNRGVKKASKADLKAADIFFKSDVECRKVCGSIKRDKVESLRARVIRSVKTQTAPDYQEGINEVNLNDLLNIL